MATFRIDYVCPAVAADVTFASHGASTGTAVRRHRVLEIMIDADARSAAAFRLVARRYRTTHGTSTAVVPTALDYAIPGTAAAEAFLGVAGENHTGEPGYPAPGFELDVLTRDFYGREGMHWRAETPTAGILVAAEANGIGYLITDVGGSGAGSTFPLTMSVIVEEL